MKNKEVIQQFLNGKNAKTENLFCEPKLNKFVLYSYGYHFPIGIKLSCGKILISCSGYSQTTAKHKGDLARGLGYSRFSDLERSGKETLLTTKQLQQVIDDENINNYSDFIASKI